VKITILIGRRRLIVQAAGWSLIDLDLVSRLRPAVRAVPDIPGHDPHGTLAAQVEQASEPAPGFGFAGSVAPVVACGKPSPSGVLCKSRPDGHLVHSWG
jgi:hypothetical protein